jgi:erythromycin esterase-like protein
MLDFDLDTLPRLIADAAEPLPDLDDDAFGSFFDRFADARVVCLGEASHGTSEFYRARAAISGRLIERHGFNIVAVEGDWPDCATIDRYVRHRPARELEFTAFEPGPLASRIMFSVSNMWLSRRFQLSAEPWYMIR